MAELPGSSRLFLISPLQYSAASVLPESLTAGHQLPVAECLWGVVARRIRASSATPAGTSKSDTKTKDSRQKRAKQGKSDVVSNRKVRRTDKLPIATSLIAPELDLRALLAYRLAGGGRGMRDSQMGTDAGDSRLHLKNLTVGQSVEISWEVRCNFVFHVVLS